MRRLPVAFVALALLSEPVMAQTSQCYWVGNVWHCEQQPQQPQGGVDWLGWSRLYSQIPNPGQAFTDAYNRAQQQRQERERAKLQAEVLAAQRDYYRSQTRPVAPPSITQSAPAPPSPEPEYMQAWLAAAAPRRHLFPDFDAVVFNPKVAISNDMVRLMSGSPYAADIAYHLGKHNYLASEIFRMPLIDQARMIDEIEDEMEAAALAEEKAKVQAEADYQAKVDALARAKADMQNQSAFPAP